MNKLLLIIFIGSLFIGCSDKKSSVNSGTVINLEEETPVCISDLFESIEVIQLETNEQCLIQTINNLIFYNNRYYILDERQQKLLCFDSVGKFLFKIDQRGQGPEEYVHINDINIDPYEQTLLLLEPWGNLFTFDLDGKFISKTKLPEEIIAYNEVHSLNRDTLIFISLNKYSLVTYSKHTNSIIDKQYDDKKGCVFSPIGKTYRYNNQLFYSPTPTNNIRNLSENTTFSWDFGKRNNTQKQINKIKKIVELGEDCPDMRKPIKEFRNFVDDKTLNYNILSNYESSRYKICVLDYGTLKPRYVFFDKQTGKANVFEKTTEGIQFFMYYFTGESIVVPELQAPFEHKFYDESILSEEQRKIINLRTDDSNPLIIKYNLKH